jgi:putative thioredoxin
MPAPRYLFDATAENFRTLVLENSDKGPVLVNYWSPRAAPCLMLRPRLIRLATEFGGRFLLVMLNTDVLGRLAREHGVTSIPTVKVFRHGRVIDTLYGAESENALRDFITRHVVSEAETRLAAAIEAQQRGDLDTAVSRAAEAALAEPDDPRLALELAKLLMQQGRYAQADDLLHALPPPWRRQPGIRDFAAHVSFVRTAREAPPAAVLEQAIAANPDDLEARYRLSALRLTQDDYEGAMAQLLEIARRDDGYRDHIGRDGLRAIFALLGENDERVRRYRAVLEQNPPPLPLSGAPLSKRD